MTYPQHERFETKRPERTQKISTLGRAAAAGVLALSVGACSGANQVEEEQSSVRTVQQAFSGSHSTAKSEYQAFRDYYIVDVDHCGGVTPCKRVVRWDEGQDTVSEGIAYGGLLAAYFDDQATLDGVWNYYRTHVNGNGVMNWKWDANNNMTGENEATDAIEDMAIALIVADKRGWGSPSGDGQTYEARAKDLIGKTLQYFVKSTNEPRPGDANWDVWDRVYNPSYILAPYATVYEQYTGNSRWSDVKNKEYEMLGLLDDYSAGAANTGLVPDWMYHNGTDFYGSEYICDVITWDTLGDGGCRAFKYSYDATRIGWRLAMDWAWHGDSRAGERLDRINAWAKPKNGVIYNGYNLDGTEFATNQYPSGVKEVLGAFVGPVAAASVKDTQSYQDTMWNALYDLGQGSNYYSDSIRIINLGFLSGAFCNPLDVTSSGCGSSSDDGGSDDDGSTTSSCGDGTCDSDEDCSSCSTDCGECTTSSSQSPYGGSAHAIPGKIEAEDFDEGGAGEAYNDCDAGNNGGAYRSEDVDVQSTSDSGGGYNVGWACGGEWLEYTVDVGSSGNYDIELRLATQYDGKSLHVEFNGSDVTGSVAVPNTGGWQNWTSVTIPSVSLSAGTQVMRIALETNSFNINYVNITSNSTSTSSCGDGVCDSDEDCSSCSTDCGSCSTCGDGVCDSDEDCSSCSSDCGSCSTCGDGVCDSSEDCSSCSTDCGSCTTGSDASSCDDSNSTDMGGRGATTTIANNACLKVTQFPSWWGTRMLELNSGGSGSFSVPFSFAQSCSSGSACYNDDGSATVSCELATTWDKVNMESISDSCAVYIKLEGDGATGDFSWY